MKKYELKDFQVPGYNKLMAQKRHLLLAKMGRGKTVICTKAMYDIGARCVLIVCPKNAIRVWEDHIKEWFQGLDDASGKDTWFNIHRWRGKYNNTEGRRATFRASDPECQVNVYITTFSAFVSDVEIMQRHNYDLVIIDEAKRIRNRNSKAFEYLKPICKVAEYVWPLTGTPGKLPGDFFTMLHLLDPRYFSSYWKFVGAYCYTQKNEFGAFEVLGLKNPDAWYQLLERKASFIREGDNHTPTVRQVLHVDLDPDQERIYREIENDMFSISGDQIIIAQTHMTKVLRYRQMMCCPKILDPNLGIGSAFADYVETIKNDTDPHTVVFTPFTAAMPHFKQHLSEHGFNNVFLLSGGLEPDEQQARIEQFRKSRGIIICSIMYATSFSLEPATECFFPGYEWDPEDNAQAEDRLNRLTTTKQVTAYYYAYNGTYTSEHLQILTTKQRQIQQTTGLVRPTKS